MFFARIFILGFLYFTIAEKCNDIKCSHIFDPVCGISKTLDNIRVIKKYHNICHLNKIGCQSKVFQNIRQIPDIICDIKSIKKNGLSGRRGFDNSIVGGYQGCNHTCPTYCVDTYDPVCVQIWRVGIPSSERKYRLMINHCHVDLISCAYAVNVTIHPFGLCFSQKISITFMAQVAALKSMRLLDGAGAAT